MSTLLEDPEEDAETTASRRSQRLAATSTGRPSFPSTKAAAGASIRSISPSDTLTLKPIPPRPALKPGDETASGVYQPIIDEIASTLREWQSLMFTYLGRRDYKLFHMVREHFEALHLGRRQLLAQTLSKEETLTLVKDCVTKLVVGNVIQGLDVIVRHPVSGGLVTADIESDVDSQSWVSGVRMYAMQISLAYMDIGPSGNLTKPPTLPYAIDHTSKPLPTPAQSAFPEYGRPRNRSFGSFAMLPNTKTAIQFYHVFLDLRAFVASLCSPGETAELYFSLYNKNDARFLTEDFCVVLNHNGVSARDPGDGRLGKLRTLFVDLAQGDVQESIYLVCRIVRNGSMKLTTTLSSSGQSTDPRRASETGPRADWDANSNAGTPLSPVRPQGALFDIQQTSYRRPFGCAVLELNQLNQLYAEQGDMTSSKEHHMPIFVPVNEAAFSTLHQDIIASKVREFTKSPR